MTESRKNTTKLSSAVTPQISAAIQKISAAAKLNNAITQSSVPKQKLIHSLKTKLREKVREKVVKEHNIKRKDEYHDKEFNPHKRVPSGIPGFDDLTEGGFVLNSINLLGGDAGSGKSLFAMQFIIKGIEQFNESGVYISFEESKIVVFERMKEYGWDLQKLENEKKFVYLQYTPEQVEQVLESGGGIIADVVQSIGAKRVVFDSLTAFAFLFDSEFKQRSSLLSLFALIRKWGCTAILIAEEEPDLKAHKANIMEFESDCDVLIYNILMENKREHVVEIYKMRGTNHSRNIYPLKIADDGISINKSVYIQQIN
ncbi:MAG: ATPase domain-containing protein [Candidatus Woesearchaeota archaeon]|jgi:circadian clock protein KaiC